MFIDTHAHIYLEDFDKDREQILEECQQTGVEKLLLPNINEESVKPMLQVCASYPDMCFPMIGLHPCDVKEDYKEVLQRMFALFSQHPFIAVGEVGIDLYWEQKYINEQKDALRIQIAFAIEHHLPVIIHKRQSYYEVMAVLDEFKGEKLSGIFHCYSGSVDHAEEIISRGFLLGFGGTTTYKSAQLDKILPYISLEHIVLETDCPYLTPVPYRGQRNKSSYIPLIAQRIADIKQVDIQTIEEATTNNAKQLFKI